MHTTYSRDRENFVLSWPADMAAEEFVNAVWGDDLSCCAKLAVDVDRERQLFFRVRCGATEQHLHRGEAVQIRGGCLNRAGEAREDVISRERRETGTLFDAAAGGDLIEVAKHGLGIEVTRSGFVIAGKPQGGRRFFLAVHGDVCGEHRWLPGEDADEAAAAAQYVVGPLLRKNIGGRSHR